MSYPFVRAKYYTVNGMTEARAILWHMAEGFGTVSWLTHPSGNNSAHFVVEKTGRIVQMVRLEDASHSAHVSIDADDRDASDCGGLYSDTVGKLVLGTGWRDINRYVVSVEVEGYRADGPNAAQKLAIRELYKYLRARLPRLRGNLGHRDVQDYKSCPGCHFPWASIDGHGLFGTPPAPDTSTEANVNKFLVNEQRTLAAVKTGAWLYDNSDLKASSGNIQLSPGRELVYVGLFSASPDIRIVAYEPAAGDTNPNSWAYFLPAASISGYRVPAPPVAPAPDCTAPIAAAVAAATAPLAAEINRLKDSIEVAVDALT